MTLWRVVGIVLAVLAVLYVAAAASGSWRWRQATAALEQRLRAEARPAAAARVDLRALDGLPAPVQRYLRTALRDGAPIVAAARLTHEGEFDLGGEREKWKPFVSTQQVSTSRPGFVWHARIFAAPGVAVQVHDAYVGGQGLLRASLLGWVTLADPAPTRELAEGELMRWLAEAAWYPTALLPGQGVRWQAVDEHSARATVADGGVEVSLVFRFGPDGLIESVRADARGRTVGGRTLPTPWEGRWSHYAERAGMQVPLTGEVAWLLPEGRRPYWRGTVGTLDYESAR